MEEGLRMPGPIPPLLASYPSRKLRTSLLPEEWEVCLDTWIFCVEFRLRLSTEKFHLLKLSEPVSGLPFLLSYLDSNVPEDGSVGLQRGLSEKEKKLNHHCFLLLRRLLLGLRRPLELPSSVLFNLLTNASIVFGNLVAWRDTLVSSWKINSSDITAAIEAGKANLILELSQSSPNSNLLQLHLRQAVELTRILQESGIVFMTGSDYLESLMIRYAAFENVESCKLLTEHAFWSLRSIMSEESPKVSLLLDHLYMLKEFSDKASATSPTQPTLLSDLLVSTTFLRHLHSHVAVPQRHRGQQLLESLQGYRDQTSHLYPPPTAKKGKGKAKSTSKDDMHVHKSVQVSQIHDLFPDLTTSYIVRLLDYFSDNVEEVTAALLEPDSLPPNLQDRTSKTAEEKGYIGGPKDPTYRPGSPKFVPRRNVFDGDDLDNLRVSTSKLHMGRKDKISEKSQTADEHARSKAAILAALATFDSDDDERDDTYDVADVGDTVDDTVDTDSRIPTKRPERANANEELLYKAWKDNPDLYKRDSKTRLSQPRQDLKRQTGMADEQLEGWAVMLGRDDGMQERLRQKYQTAVSFSGSQNRLHSTRWQADNLESDDAGSAEEGPGSAATPGQRTGTRPPRVGRHIGGRGGGNTAGPASEHSTQAARRRKEQGRGRGGANHNRREGRAKKIGRGMGGPAL